MFAIKSIRSTTTKKKNKKKEQTAIRKLETHVKNICKPFVKHFAWNHFECALHNAQVSEYDLRFSFGENNKTINCRIFCPQKRIESSSCSLNRVPFPLLRQTLQQNFLFWLIVAIATSFKQKNSGQFWVAVQFLVNGKSLAHFIINSQTTIQCR